MSSLQILLFVKTIFRSIFSHKSVFFSSFCPTGVFRRKCRWKSSRIFSSAKDNNWTEKTFYTKISMKNSIIFLLLFAPAIAFSQSYGFFEYDVDKFFRMGFNAELNINKIQGKSFTDEYNFNYGARGFMQFNFSRKFGVQPEVGYNQVSSKQSTNYSDIWDDISSAESQLKVKLNYLKFGAMVNYNLCRSTTWLKLQFGPQWGMLLNEKVDSLKTPQDIFKKGEFSLAAGIMAQLSVVHLGVRFEQGLTDINAIDDRDKWKTQSFQIFAGMTF
jgi:hypothetical protein